MTAQDETPTGPDRAGMLARVAALLVVTVIGIAVGARWHGTFEGWVGATSKDVDAVREPAEPDQLWTCGMHPQVIQDHPGECPICHMELTPLDGDVPSGIAITIDPAVVQNMGVQTAVATKGPLVRSIRAVGTVAEAEPNIREVNLRVSGWIRRLHADTEGMVVGKHAPLFDLYSPELQVAIEELIRLGRNTSAATSGESPATRGRSLHDAAVRRLEFLGLPGAQINRLSALERAPKTVTFTSPIAGTVTDKRVVEGAAVEAGASAMRIVDHSTLWIEASVFEQDLGLVSIGQKVVATVTAHPGERFAGEIIFVDPYVDPATRTVTVRMRVANEPLRLRPGMFATVEIVAELAPAALLVPREAVIDTGVRQIIFVALGEGRFEPRDVEMGHTDDNGNVQILAGLIAGESVVTSGQFLLDSESRLREAVQKFLRERAGSPPPVVVPRRIEPAAEHVHETKPPADDRPSPTIYTCPMHLQVRRDGPAQCPICGMDLVVADTVDR